MPVKGKAVVIGGGTVFHVRPHLALSAPAYGSTATYLARMLRRDGWDTELVLTKMAGGGRLETNADIQRYIEKEVLPNPDVKVLVMSAALCDYEGFVCYPFDVSASVPVTDSGKNQPRLKTSEGKQHLWLEPANKVINQIRKTRKDIFLVGFKTTAGASEQEMFHAGLGLLKNNSCNLVFANDVHNYNQMIITPEQAVYGDNTRRDSALDKLAEMVTARANLTFTRSTVIDGDRVAWGSDLVPPALRKVVDYMIAKGAYKPFQGATVGHFAVKIGDGQFLTSIRKSNFNNLGNVGLVRVETQGDDQVVAYGARPSVGGQSQRLVFGQHPDVDCIAHAHVSLSAYAKDDIPVRPQWKFECGSHECGQNTSSGLKDFGGGIKAVMLDQHGPNIVFSRNADPDQVIRFIEANWDLDRQTSPL